MPQKTGLQSFGTFLRNFGAGLNPQVAAQLRQEEQLKAQKELARVQRQQTIEDQQTKMKFNLITNELKNPKLPDDRRAELEGIASDMIGQPIRTTAPAAKKEPLFAKINPKDFTPESVAVFEETGRRSDLVAVPKAPLVNISNRGESAATKAFGGKVGEEASKRNVFAESAIAQNQQLDRVLMALSNGANTGKFEEFKLEAKSLAQTFGVDIGDPAKMSEQEVIRKISNEMALRLRNPDSGLGLTGNTSNKDLDFLKASVIGLSRTERGNQAIIHTMKKFNAFKVALARKQAEIIEKAGKVPLSLDSQLIKFANNYQMFNSEEREEISAIANDATLKDKEEGVSTPQTDEEFNALPAGAKYRDPDDGRLYIK